MSCYIVEDETINRIVSFCFWEHEDRIKHTIKQVFEDIGINLWGFHNDKETDNAMRIFGEKLLAMNVMSYYARYSHQEDTKDDIAEAIKEYKFEDLPLSEREHCQVLMSIQCFLYQCSEGDVDETPLFLGLRKIEESIKSHLISQMPKYQKAKWG